MANPLHIEYDDTLRQGTDKLNVAIDHASEALGTANSASTNVASAVIVIDEKVTEIDVIKDEVIVLKDEVTDATNDLNVLIAVTDGVVQEVSQFTFIDAYSSTVAYSKNNTVSYNGSSYVAKQGTIGNPPTDTAYWALLAQRGVDGEGAVGSVNGNLPDPNGNVEIVIPDPDLSGLATKQELQVVDDALTTHEAERASLNEAGHVKAETDEEGNLVLNKDKVGLGDAENKSSETIRTESTTALRTEVVSSLPQIAKKGRIVFHDNADKPTFKGFNGGEWV